MRETGDEIVRNEFLITKKDLREVLSKRAWINPGTLIPAIIAVLALSYGCAAIALTKQYRTTITVVLFGALFLYWFVNRFYVVRVNVNENMQRFEEIGAEYSITSVEKNAIVMTTKDGKLSLRVPYKKIKRVMKTKNMVVLCTKSGHMILLRNGCYTVGDRKLLMKTLKNKCPHLKFRSGLFR